MITVEQIYKRIKKGPEENTGEWKPLRPSHPWTLPTFNIEIPKSHSGPKYTKEGLSKILTFIDLVKRKRFKTGATVMPISTHHKKYLAIWNSPVGVTRAIEKMIRYGLIVEENKTYRHHAYWESDNYSRTYLYFVDNEKKIIDYCEKNGIKKYEPPKRKVNINKLSNLVKQLNPTFDETKVRFSNDLELIKPDTLTIDEFEELLDYFLKKNYPYYTLIKDKVEEINEYYDDEDFKISFEPKFHWSEKPGKTNVVEGIVIRATNSYCNKKKISRYWFKKRNQFILEHDIKSSVPRLTLSMNSGHWVDESVDIYELIGKEIDPNHKVTKVKRDAIKKLHMWCYFDESSDKNLGKNVWFQMDKSGAKKNDVDKTIGELRKAVVKVEGGKLFGVEIFFIESCVYLMTLYDLLKAGVMTWLVYDAFYSKDFVDKEMFDSMIENGVRLNFEDFLRCYKF